MKTRITLSILLSLFLTTCFSQGLKIVNSKKSKTIDSTNYVEIRLQDITDNKEQNCCSYTILEGSIQSVKNDSILILVSRLSDNNSTEDWSSINNYNWDQDNRLQAIHQKDVLYLSAYKSKKGKKNRKRLTTLGGILFFGGAITAVNAFAIKNKQDRKNLRRIAAMEIGVGLALAISSRQKRHYFKKSDDPWRFVE